MKRFDNKTALVTGAGQGIGRASAIALAGEGASVAVADINLPNATAVAEEIASAGGRAIAVGADVRREEQVAAMVQATVEAFGGLDILHNNAAALSADAQRGDGDLLEMDVGLWDLVMEVNLRGAMLGCKHGLPHLIRRGGGAVINTASVQSSTGTPTRAAYAASKAAIVSLTRSIAIQFGGRGVRCNAVGPSFTSTPAATESTTEEQRESLRRLHPIGRLGTPEDIAQVVVFLADDEQSGYVTGHLLMADGGRLAVLPGSVG